MTDQIMSYLQAANRDGHDIIINANPADLPGRPAADLGWHGLLRVPVHTNDTESGATSHDMLLLRSCERHAAGILCFGCGAAYYCPPELPLAVYREYLTRVTWERACHDGDKAVYQLDEHGAIELVAMYPETSDLADTYREALEIERQLHEAAVAAALFE